MTVDVDAWIDALVDRHTRVLTRPELLKAIRALSARYVERRADLPRRSPIDSAGKRAAFAAFYAPLHFFTARAIAAALAPSLPHVDRILDLGCGTGVTAAAWAMACDRAPAIEGIDRDAWSLAEAAWNWRALGLRGRTRRGDMLDAWRGRDARSSNIRVRRAEAIVLGWSVNELAEPARAALFAALRAASMNGAVVLVIEPLARAAAPWWDEWARAALDAGGRVDEWKFPVDLPARLRDLDDAAGFRREHLGARTLLLSTASSRGARAESAADRRE
jgi:SAM-dependent methyltransferase